MEFTAPQIIYLVISSIITFAAVITLMRPPLTRLGLRDRAYLQVLIERELENQLSKMDLSETIDALCKRGVFEDHEQENLKR